MSPSCVAGWNPGADGRGGQLCWAVLVTGILKVLGIASNLCRTIEISRGLSAGSCCPPNLAVCDDPYTFETALGNLLQRSVGIVSFAEIESEISVSRRPVVLRLRRNGMSHVVAVVCARREKVDGIVQERVSIDNPNSKGLGGWVAFQDLSHRDWSWDGTIFVGPPQGGLWQPLSANAAKRMLAVPFGVPKLAAVEAVVAPPVLEGDLGAFCTGKSDTIRLSLRLGKAAALRFGAPIWIYRLGLAEATGLPASEADAEDYLGQHAKFSSWLVPVFSDRSAAVQGGVGVSTSEDGDGLVYTGIYKRKFCRTLARASGGPPDREPSSPLRILTIVEAAFDALWSKKEAGYSTFLPLPPLSFGVKGTLLGPGELRSEMQRISTKLKEGFEI